MGDDRCDAFVPRPLRPPTYTELSLMEIIRDARQLLDKEGSVPETHNLEHLWNTAEPLLKKIADSPETFRDVRECIAHFARLDPISESFRYPVKKTGELTLPKQLHNVDLAQARAVMQRLASFLDAATTHTFVELEHKLDYLAEMQRAYGSAW